jgi:hypothetical protein
VSYFFVSMTANAEDVLKGRSSQREKDAGLPVRFFGLRLTVPMSPSPIAQRGFSF